MLARRSHVNPELFISNLLESASRIASRTSLTVGTKGSKYPFSPYLIKSGANQVLVAIGITPISKASINGTGPPSRFESDINKVASEKIRFRFSLLNLV